MNSRFNFKLPVDLQKVFLAFCLCFLSNIIIVPNVLFAQTIIQPHEPNFLVGNSGKSPDFLNCDLITKHATQLGSGSLAAFSWINLDNGTSSPQAVVAINEDLEPSLTASISFPGVTMAKIVLIDDISQNGSAYLAVLAMVSTSGDAYIQTIKILNVGTGNPLQLQPTGNVIQLNTQGTTVDPLSLSLDTYGDFGFTYQHYFPAIYNFAVCWRETVGTTTNLKLRSGRATPILSLSTPVTIASPTVIPPFTGLAAYESDIHTPYVFWLYYDNTLATPGYTIKKYKILAGAPPTFSYNYFNITNDLGLFPSIDALGLEFPSMHHACIIAGVQNNSSTSTFDLNVYDSTIYATTSAGTTISSVNSANQVLNYPCISAYGAPYGSSFLKNSYVIGWCTDTNILTQPVDITIGTPPTSDYYKVNMGNPVPLALKKGMAMSGSNNSALHFLTAWIDAKSQKVYCKITSNVTGFKPTSISENTLDNLVTIFPNPTFNQVTIQANGNGKIESIEVFNLLGQEMKRVNVNKSPNEYNLDLTGLATGVYNLMINTDKGQAVRKLNVLK